jgi:glycosyltransferase involved in cell wall biosynthesis
MKVNCRGLFFSLSCYKWTKLFKEYNFISANSYYAGLLAYNINFKYKIPFSISWTGSDIHTYPFLNPSMFKWTKRLLVSAQNNFFCSEKLAETSTKIALETNRVVLYHGVDKNLFKKYDVSQLNSIKKEFLINSNNKNVAFFGRLESIKNIHYLPKIFNRIKTNIPYTSFFIIGDGKLRQVIQKECDKLDFKVSILGYIDLLYMPALINCMDLILLPSKNEGLPVIALESIACGVPIIGSRVGGIPEVIGLENTVEINEMFIEKFSTLAIDVLSQKRDIMLNPVFDWDKTAELEGRIYDKYK